ncbi:PEPxxWA-CTERM sorting domain-containing protein [Sphingomonas sp. M1-B02]|uniref:PEPxxWA-CTERM sorting domain-containing protein n=1 Tax=Sphingomonas sp. M1-B02 TaxID=3114300 RepID=UPI002240E2B3|nr:PEPxxWA-CTERM sorting domain-containing protein [Sphingomonas sp. S6-11]UZK67796.1 PEPxxWA-CTERM sorting domain-containing protein [Sphingomonas sp. S6-11]
MLMDMKVAKRIKSGLTGATALGLLAIANPAYAASLLQYNFSDNSGITATEAPSFVAANLTGVNFTRGSGLTPVSASDGFNSSGWSAFASNANDYLNFGFNVTTGYSAVVNQLAFTSSRSNTGPSNMAVFAAVDGGAFTQVSTFTQSTSDTSRILDFAPLTGASSIFFRIVATSAASAPGGTFRVENYTPSTNASPFSLNGNVSAIPVAVPSVPEPATWAMMLMGFGAIGAGMRRGKKQNVGPQFATA